MVFEMLVKLVLIVVVVLAVMTVVRRFRTGMIGGRKTLSAARCKHCGRPLIGSGPCGCGGKG
jgi:fumarate reductase subunit D